MTDPPLRLFDEVGILQRDRITIGSQLRNHRGHSKLTSVDGSVHIAAARNVFAGHSRASHADQVHARNAIDVSGNTPWWNIDRRARVPLHKGAFADSAELMNGGAASHDDAVANTHMAAKGRTVRHLNVVAHLRVMPHV